MADLEALVAVDSDDEFLDLLLDMYVDRAEERREERQGRHGLAFDLDGLSDTACVEKFRFPKADVAVQIVVEWSGRSLCGSRSVVNSQ